MRLGLPLFGLSPPKLADAWVKDAFKAFAGGRVGKNGAGQFVAIQMSFFVDHLRAKGSADFGQGRLAGLDDSARKVISIDHGDVAGANQLSAGGFAHSDAAREAEEFHSGELGCLGLGVGNVGHWPDCPSSTAAGIPKPRTKARIILRLRLRRPERTSETLLRLPRKGTRSVGLRPCCSIRKRMASTGSGLSIGKALSS